MSDLLDITLFIVYTVIKILNKTTHKGKRKMIVKENKMFRISTVENVKNSSFFVEGKNIFGRWVIGQHSIKESEVETVWAICEEKAAQFTK